MFMTIFVRSRKWLISSIAWSDLAVCVLFHFVGGEENRIAVARNEPTAVIATSVARKHRKGRSGDADERAELTQSRSRGTSRTASGLERERDAFPRRERGI